MRKTRILLLLIFAFGMLARVAPAASDASEEAIGRTPPRLSFVAGQVSFWRPGTEEWVPAQINTALAPGDQLFAGTDSRMEIQIGGQAFARGGANTQIGLESLEPDFLQLKVTTGQASLDLRTITAGRMVEVGTPNAAFLIRTEGYYRLDVGEERTVFITRRSGRATAISGGGDKVVIGPNEEITVEGPPANPSFASRTAPRLDSLDQWNYARTEGLKPQESARYLSPEIYGISELDRHGTWRVVPTYGSVWIPRGVAVDWVPYSTGVWMHDPYYGWTWADSMPWGWAPFHYGRWVRYGGSWCWAPGPRVNRPVYAPALVAFYGQPGFQVSVGVTGPVVGWVSLSWGEPLVPWWGRPGFMHRPWWGGWAGPRIVNNRVVHNTTVVNITEINIYRNTRERNALIVVDKDRFGRGPITHVHRHRDNPNFRPTHMVPKNADIRAGRIPPSHRGGLPETHLRRPVVSVGRKPGSPAHPGGPDRTGTRQANRPSPQQPSATGPRHSSTIREGRTSANTPAPLPQNSRTGQDANRRTRTNDPATSPPAIREGGSERRRGSSNILPRPAPPNPQPSQVARPEPSAPRAPEQPRASPRPTGAQSPVHIVPQAPGSVTEGSTRPRVQPPATDPRIESGGRTPRDQNRRNAQATAAPSEPRRPQAPNRGAAPLRVEPGPSQGTSDRSPVAQTDSRGRPERPSESMGPRGDAPNASQWHQGPNSQAPQGRQQNRRTGRDSQ